MKNPLLDAGDDTSESGILPLQEKLHSPQDDHKRTVHSGSQSCSDILLLWIYFLIRYIVLSVIYFLCVIACLYGLGNLITLKATNFYCDPNKSLQEVRQHSIEHNLQYGDDHYSCWYIDRQTLNFNDIFQIKINIFEASWDDTGWINIMQCIIYSLLALILLFVAFYHTIWTLYDTYYTIIGKNNPRVESAMKLSDVGNHVTDNICWKCYNLFKKCRRQWIDSYYYTGSKWYIIIGIFKQFIQIFVQFYALLLYGGVSIVSIIFNGKNSNVLTQEPHIVLNFSIILSTHCILIGILYILYVVKSNLLNGKIFNAIIFFIDCIFEIIYILFPLVYINTSSSDHNSIFSAKTLGLLNETNEFILTQSIVAMMFLTYKCWIISSDLQPINIYKHYILSIDSTNDNYKKPYIYHSSKFVFTNDLYRIVISKYDILSKHMSIALGDVISDMNSGVSQFQFQRGRDSSLTQNSVTESIRTDSNYYTYGKVSINNSNNNNGSHGDQEDEKNISIDENSLDAQQQQQLKQRILCRKITIAIPGIILIVSGVLILAFFTSFIAVDYQNKCINALKDSAWIEKHPELKYFDQYCTKKGINIFSNYPCNCRQFEMSSVNTSIMTNDDVQAIFANFNNLEGIYMSLNSNSSATESLARNETFQLSNDMFEKGNLIHLRILVIDGLSITHIGDKIKLLKSLEIFMLNNILASLYFPFDAISNLDSLKAIRISQTTSLTNDKIPESFCNLKELKYFFLSYTGDATSIPLDCISSQLKNLQYFEISVSPSVTGLIDPKLWLLPKLTAVFLTFSQFNQSSLSFDTFEGYSSSLTKVSFYGNSFICDGSITIDDTTYDGFGYLGANGTVFSTSDSTNSKLLQFIVSFDPCYTPCTSSDGNKQTFLCTSSEWQNGLCDSQCFNKECSYDGGDCNQLCSTTGCNSTILTEFGRSDSDTCDSSCNNTLCSYDFYNCVNSNESANATCSINSINLINDTNLIDEDFGISLTDDDDEDDQVCYTAWTDSSDVWCDANCNVTSCNFDNGLCNTCAEGTGNCYLAYIYIIQEFAAIEAPYELITVGEFCDNFQTVQTLVGDSISDDNCTVAFHQIDLNGNDLIGMWEAIVATYQYWNIQDSVKWKKKLNQIDCSFCFTNSSLYYL